MHSGMPLRPAILYGIDTRADSRDRRADRALRGRQHTLPLRLAAHEPGSGSKAGMAAQERAGSMAADAAHLHGKSFIVYRLTGEYVLDHHSASQCDPLYDLKENRWIEEWADEVAPGLELPRLLWPSEVAGTVSAAPPN